MDMANAQYQQINMSPQPDAIYQHNVMTKLLPGKVQVLWAQVPSLN